MAASEPQPGKIAAQNRRARHDYLIEQTVEVKPMSPHETTKYFEDEATRWQPLARALYAAQAKQ